MILGLLLFGIAILGSLFWLWVGGFDYMNQYHKDYKGEDFFSEDDKNSVL
jgi:hypothetical protein